MFSKALLPFGYSKLAPCGKGSDSYNSLPGNKILDKSKLKASANNKVNATEKLKFCFGREENFGKGEKLGTSIFSFSHIVFVRTLSRVDKNGVCVC